ncbi:MAG: ABC transporter ATP-binding protein [Acidobacteriota bacterium]
MIALRQVRFAHRGRPPLLKGCDLAAGPGEVVALAGPNGAGKSTLLRIAAGLVAPDEGEVELDGRPVQAWGRLGKAKRLAYVPQKPLLPEGWKVREILALGDHPHRERPPAPRPLSVRLAEAQRLLDLEGVWEREAETLSGGEAQRVAVGRALVQDTPHFVLDEPANHLDLGHQVALYRLFQAWARKGRTVLLASHDLNLSLLFGQRLVLLNGEGIVKVFPDGDEARGRLLEEAFGLPFEPREVSGCLCWFPRVAPEERVLSPEALRESNQVNPEGGKGP